MRGFEKKIFVYHSYVPMRFLEAAPGSAAAIEKNFFRFRIFYIKLKETTAG
jgi:hypothetical protein